MTFRATPALRAIFRSADPMGAPVRTFATSIIPPIGVVIAWILASGFWADTSAWADTQVWKDS